MSTIINKGGFDFMCKTKTGKTISCFLDNSEPVEANFDKLELSYNGTIKVQVSRNKIVPDKKDLKKFNTVIKKDYITVSRLKPRDEKDQSNFNAASHETEIVSNKRKQELKNQRKAQDRLKEPKKRSA